jgi:hypothetical protein
MNVKPIMFSAPTIQALLDGRKTQTRRVLKPQPFPAGYYEGEVHCSNVPAGARFTATAIGGAAITTDFIEYPIRVGDVLWVREAWVKHASGIDYRAGFHTASITQAGPWRSPIHMPRWASRLTLVVTDVRVQRLQEISEDDAIEEGIDFDSDYANLCANIEDAGYANDLPKGSAVIAIYRRLWETINGRGTWDTNPWVAAYTFTVHQQNVDVLLKSEAVAV